MSTRVLVPVDESEFAKEATKQAAELFPEGTLVLIHVINPAEAGFGSEATIPSFPEGWYEQRQQNAESQFDELESLVADQDVTIERVVEIGGPTRTIVDTIEDETIDHVVMGSTGRQGVSRILLGSVAEGVVRRSPVPVTIVR